MKPKYLKYYETYSSWGSLVFLMQALFAKSRLEKASLLNRHKDYLGLGSHPELLKIHHAVNLHLLEQRQNWKTYDYGEGYFYQSLDSLGITGYRNTRLRVENFKLREILRGKTVLEIGCNTGFIALSISDVVKKISGFDLNPYLVAIAKECADYLNLHNTEFSVSSFEEFNVFEKFGAVLSFANHSTYDGNTEQKIEDYFKKCRDLLVPGGIFLFESHPPEIEKGGFKMVCETLERFFEIQEQKVFNNGGFLDNRRTFIHATVL